MPDELGSELHRRAALVGDWSPVLALAEEHGLGPLLYRHLVGRATEVPERVARSLRAVYVRHRRINEVLLAVLAEIVTALRAKQIESLVLKGPVLATTVYDEPALRPISDLDILVAERHALRAQRVLDSLGFAVDLPTSMYHMRRHHHLHGASKLVDGVPVLVEIHRDALSADRSSRMTFEEQRQGAQTFYLDTTPVQALERHEMLWHLCRHMVGLWHPFRLVWVADIIGYADRFVDEIDWAFLRRSHPFVLSTLTLVHHLTPLPDPVIRHAGLSVGETPSQVCVDYLGWPRSTAFVWDDWSGRLQCLQRSLSPPDWWLRLNYGTGTRNRAWGRGLALAKHITTLAGIVARRVGDLLPRRDPPPPG